MTIIGTIKLYSGGHELIKKWDYWGSKNRAKIFDFIKKNYAGKGCYYQVYPYLYSKKFEGCLLPGNLDDIKRLKSLSLKKQ